MKKFEHLLFITGVGRSGTTLLQGMLNAHSKIGLSPESHFNIHYLSGKETLTQEEVDIEELKALLREDSNIQRLDIHVDTAIESAKFESKGQPFYPALFRSMMDLYFSEHLQYAGDKDPMYVYFLPLLNKAFPNSRLIRIDRDPRDVILSRLKSGWGNKYPLLQHVFEYKYGIELAKVEGQQRFGDRQAVCRYEDLLSDPEKVMTQLCAFLGLDFEADMLHHEAGTRKLIASDEADWKQNATKPIMKGNSGKWKTELSGSRLWFIESILANELKELGYESSKDRSLSSLFMSIPILPAFGIFKILKDMKRKAQ